VQDANGTFLGFLKKSWGWIRDLFGFRRNSKYVSNHLNEANIRSSIYMCFVILVIEIWMIIRKAGDVSDAIQDGTNWFDALFSYTSLYFLFIIASVAMLTFGVFYLDKKERRRDYVVPFIFGGALILYSLFLVKEISQFKSWDTLYYRISNEGVIGFYIFAFLLGVFILLHTIFKIKNKRNSYYLSIAVVVSFAFMCLAFGIKVGYTDFFSRFYLGTGLPKATGDGTFEIKSMLCFLTMILYVGCLLIWKPYISIAMLTTFFMGFYVLLDADAQNRIFADGEKVNYITFLISLTVVTVSIYQQRLREEKKERGATKNRYL